MGFTFNTNTKKSNHFLIVTLCKNVEKYIEKCIESTKTQTHQKFLHVIIDDNSSDNTVPIIEKCIKGDSRYVLYKHNVNFYTTSNHIIALMNYGGIDDIVIHLDGDDNLYTDDVLEKLNNIYSDKNVWCTFGSYLRKPDNYRIDRKELCLPDKFYEPRQMVKDLKWIFTHLRTFRKFLFYHIPINYFLNSEYRYYKAGVDCVLFLPVLELAGKNRIKFIDDILLIYNHHGSNEHITLKKEQDDVYIDTVFNKPALVPLTDEETKKYFRH